MEKLRDRWGSRPAFIMAAVGSAVGLGNVWRFPYIAFKNGGGAFLIPYFVALITAGIPLMIVEYALGQSFQCGTPRALEKVDKKFHWLGWLAVLVGTSIVFYYVVVMSYAGIYMLASWDTKWTEPVAIYETKIEDHRAVETEISSDRIRLFHLYGDGDERQRQRLEKAEAKKDKSEQWPVYSASQVENLQAEEKLKPEAERMRYVQIETNVSNYFFENTLRFRSSRWGQIKAHNDPYVDAITCLTQLEKAEFVSGMQVTVGSELRRIAEKQIQADGAEEREAKIQAMLVAIADVGMDPSTPIDAEGFVLDSSISKKLGDRQIPYKGELFQLSTKLVIASIVIWAIIFLIIYKGVGRVGKIVMVTVPMPLILLAILIFAGCRLPGAGQGIEYYLKPNWEILKDPGVWMAAYGQIFFSLSLGFGILVAYASYVPREADVANNAFMTSFANCATSFLAGFAVFSVLGYLAYLGNTEVSEVVKGGPGLVFITYPIALATLGGVFGRVVGILFFLCLLFLGIDSAFSIVEAIVTSVRDHWPKARRRLVALVICVVGAVCSIFYCTRSGLMWLDIMDNWMSNYGLAMVGLLECIAVGYFFDFDELKRYINEHSEIQLGGWFDQCIKIVTPVVLIVLLGTQFLEDITKVYGYGEYDKVLYGAVKVGGWGWMALILVLAFALSRSWTALWWVASGIVLYVIFHHAAKLDPAAAAMGAIGAVLLYGGFLVCLRIALKGKRL